MAGLIAIFVALAASVGGVTLRDGEQFRLQRETEARVIEATGVSTIMMLILQTAFAIAWLLVPVAIILAIVTRQGRATLLRIAIMSVVLLLIMRTSDGLGLGRLVRQGDTTALAAPQADAAVESLPVPEPPAPPSEWLVIAASAVVSVALLALAFWVYKRGQSRHAGREDNRLAEHAQSALDALRGGAALTETIQRCYHEMCATVARDRRIERGAAMTPAEFQMLLVGRGMPSDAVGTLTRLFEQIRYGAVTADVQQQQQAIDSLEKIAAAARAR
jgi:hypothetical protein